MASLQQIIDYLDRKCPDHGETDANICSDLNDLHNDIFLQLGRLSNNVEITESSDTISGQLAYSLPSNCRFEDIVKIEVATDTSDSEFEEYEYAGLNDDTINGNYFGRYTSSTFFLLKDNEPTTTTGLTVHIYHYKRPTQFDSSDLSYIPELDTDYHDLLKFGIVQAMFEQGAHPDTELADYWQKKFDEKLFKVKMELESRHSNAPLSVPQIREYL